LLLGEVLLPCHDVCLSELSYLESKVTSEENDWRNKREKLKKQNRSRKGVSLDSDWCPPFLLMNTHRGGSFSDTSNFFCDCCLLWLSLFLFCDFYPSIYFTFSVLSLQFRETAAYKSFLKAINYANTRAYLIYLIPVSPDVFDAFVF
jgi:hypothetical protein